MAIHITSRGYHVTQAQSWTMASNGKATAEQKGGRQR